MNSSRSTCNLPDRPPPHLISSIARLTFFSSNSVTNLASCKATGPVRRQESGVTKRNSLSSVYNQVAPPRKETYLSVNSSYFPQNEFTTNDNSKCSSKNSSSRMLNVSFPAISGDLPALKENIPRAPPRESPSHPYIRRSLEYGGSANLPSIEKKNFRNFTNRHYSELSPVSIYSGGIKDLHNMTTHDESKEMSLSELLR